MFLSLAGFWGLAVNGFLYAYVLRTGSPSVVNVTLVLFMPLTFLTTLFVPRHALSSWLATVADFNPVTYVLAGLRALIGSGLGWRCFGWCGRDWWYGCVIVHPGVSGPTRPPQMRVRNLNSRLSVRTI